jgi:hypothetical protein
MSATVEDQLEHILRQLNRRILVPWVTEMRLGKPVYDFLLSAVRERPLTKHQRANLLVALYRLKGHGKDEDVLPIFIEHATHTEIRVRGQAISLLIGLMREHNFIPPYLTDESVSAIRSGVSMGLYENSERVARSFLEMAGRSEAQ